MAETQKIPGALAFEVCRVNAADREPLREMYLSYEPKGAAMGLPPRGDPGHWLESLSQYPNFMVTIRGRLVGHGALCVEGDSAEAVLFIHQDWRGRGLGKRLLAALISEARRVGLSRIWGMTEADNIPMLRLARSLGFAPGKHPEVYSLDLAEEPHLAKVFDSAA